jgi:hypothetical protein
LGDEINVPLANPEKGGQAQAMSQTVFQDIRDSLRKLYLEDGRPWLVGFSGGKDGTMLASPTIILGGNYERNQTWGLRTQNPPRP